MITGNDLKQALHYAPVKNEDTVHCGLCPRECLVQAGSTGFCGVRTNQEGTLYTCNYGLSVSMTEELIETEAVYEYLPGERILSLGNVGCMMKCDFCQNWETSQIQHLDPLVVTKQSPRDVVDAALKRNIKVLSWTYNDPVVWHEFVLETAKLAKAQGLINLYKSAFYISEKAVEDLLEAIDVFSISLKSLSPEFYAKYTKAELAPVLEAIKLVARSDAHLELSNLVVPGANDSKQDFVDIANWVLDNLGPDVPLHFVRFHPSYKYLHVDRTPIDVLKTARETALQMGIKSVYLGNIFEEGLADTCCKKCGSVLINRFGYKVELTGIDRGGLCTECRTQSAILVNGSGCGDDFMNLFSEAQSASQYSRTIDFDWSAEESALHISCDHDIRQVAVRVRHLPGGVEQVTVLGDLHGVSRIQTSQLDKDEKAVRIDMYSDEDLSDAINIFPLLDRAHYPVI